MITQKRKLSFVLILVLAFILAGGAIVYAWTGIPVVDDPLVRMPGTQPNQVALQAPTRCMNCHAGYDPAVEPGFNWQGSMMAQSARDFLFWSCMTVSAQDSIWAVGSPNATDICERCHFPKGWLEGRSDPTNASLMTGADYDGVQCDFCHRMWDPFFETTYAGTREGSDWLGYWDETNASGTPSQLAADLTYADDLATSLTIQQFDGANFFTSNIPPANYTESTSGQYFVSPDAAKRASFADANARHQMFYSRFHKSKFMCATCLDVSNPILANLGLSGLPDLETGLITEQYSAANYFHVERTFSEFMLSAYGQQGGAETNPEFQALAPNITTAAKCQDCHMRDVVGPGADLRNAVVRPNESVEHPNSGQPLHDMTGGNAWVSTVLASAIPGSPNYDATNDLLLNQGPAVLTLDLTQGEGIDPVALLAGADRAQQQLLLAATIKNVTYDSASGALSFQVQNNSAHKLISGFPEGRRMFVNIRAYDAAGSLIYEANPYDMANGTLKGLSYPYQPDPNGDLDDPQPLGANEIYVDELVYEMKPTSTLTGEEKTFHFALATGRYKDNRIPPKGFNIAAADERIAVPVWHGVEDPNYFTEFEYLGGYDEVNMTIPTGATAVEINLYYQTTSREYIEFLRDEINGTGNLTLSSPTPSGENEAYVIQNDPFFSQLKAWGDTLWQLWTHNMNLDGAAPFLMTSATVGVPPTGCTAPTPALLSATPGNTEVTLLWSDESADPSVAGYKVYYDQAGKAQLIADITDPALTSFTDTGLTNGVEYFYKVTSYYDGNCESIFSNIVNAIPTNAGQATDPAGAAAIETGIITGKGNSQTYTTQTIFNPGDGVVIRVTLIDGITGLPVADAVVDLLITGPESLTLVTGLSDATGVAEVTWQTKAPRKNNAGTLPGNYTVEVKGITATGYHWDGISTSTTFTIQ